jgi:hypothetical protein
VVLDRVGSRLGCRALGSFVPFSLLTVSIVAINDVQYRTGHIGKIGGCVYYGYGLSWGCVCKGEVTLHKPSEQ